MLRRLIAEWIRSRGAREAEAGAAAQDAAIADSEHVTDALAQAQSIYDAGDTAGADAILRELLAGDAARPERAALLPFAGHTARKLGDHRRAIELLREAAAAVPERADVLADLALALLEAGMTDEAGRHARRALALAPDTPNAHHVLARIALRGEDYVAALTLIHELLRPPTYVEIGISTGDSLRLVRPETQAIGIDPKPQLAYVPGANTRVFVLTSEAFFAQQDLRALLGGQPVALAFIDGMHHFEYALRDFVTLERYCAPGSTILLHDGYPLDAVTAARERSTGFWSGDVWRAVHALKAHRPDLSIATLAAPPTGLTVVRNLDPSSRLLEQRFDAIVEEYRALPFEAIAADKPARLNLVPGARADIAALFAARA